MAKKTNLWLCFSVSFFSLVVFHTWRKSEVIIGNSKFKQPQPSPPTKLFSEPLRLQSFLKPKDNEKISILAWNNYWRWPDFGIGEGNQGFKEHNCSYTNCFLSLDRKKIDTVDAILMHGHGMTSTDALRRSIKTRREDTNGNGWPLIVYFNKESVA